MKANEAPDKIYMNWVNYPLEEMQVEYIRVDAFIKKACDAFCKKCKIPNCRSNECKMISDFKGHLQTNMKEE